jgi:WD40 repeat protein
LFAAALAVATVLAPPSLAQPQTVNHFGTTRFRAQRPVGDARYSFDGKHIVGHAGNRLYVWDAADGTLLRTIATNLDSLGLPTIPQDERWAFAVHTRKGWVAFGGVRGGKTQLQIWDFQTGKIVAEKVSPCDDLKVLAWTPDGKRLLERSNVGWDKPTAWKLIVRDDKLAVVHAHELPNDFGQWSTVMHPLPDGKRVLLWQEKREPILLDLVSGAQVGTVGYKVDIPSDVGISADGKTLVATGTNEICLLDIPGGTRLRDLPVRRSGWHKPRPLFSPDGKTVYVWDFRPVAYDVAGGKEKWRPYYRTTHTVRMRPCDITPDGSTLLARQGHALAFLDARTGAQRPAPDGPTMPADLLWSPDGKRIFTRKFREERTWTAWDAVSGKRLYDLQPTGHAKDDDWKMLPDLFFVRGGKEMAACLERTESTERVGPKEFLVFDAATGQCLRRLGEPLPDDVFRWTYPIGVDEQGTTVLMQVFVDRAPGMPWNSYATIRWDPVKKAKVQEWAVEGHRTDGPRHFAPYNVTLGNIFPGPDDDRRPPPATIRCYDLADGKLAHELASESTTVEEDRLAGNFLLSVGYDSKWTRRGNTLTYKPQPPWAYDLWELPSRDKVRVFELPESAQVALGPGGRYVLRVLDNHTFEVHEPFVLKKAVAKVAAPCRPEVFEFSPAGDRLAASLCDTTVMIWDTTAWHRRIEGLIAAELPADLAVLWDDLAKDATAGLRACRLLSAAGDRGVAFLEKRIAAKKAPREADVRRRIADLDSPRFDEREQAARELEEVAAQAEAQLRKELQNKPSAEARRRIEELLGRIDGRQLCAAERREVRAVQALVWMNCETARKLLRKWTEGDPKAALTRAARQATAR